MPVLPAKMKNPVESWNDADWNLFNIIRKTVKEDQKAVQETARTCKKLFKKKDNPANPREVLTELGELLRAGQDGQTLAKHIDQSKQKNGPKTPDELKESLKKQREDYECYIQHFLPALKAEITESKKLAKLPALNQKAGQSQARKDEILQIISDITNKGSDRNHSSSTIQNQNDRKNSQIDRQGNAMGLLKNKSSSSEVAVAESSGSSALERDSLTKGVSGTGTLGKYNILRNSSRYDASSPPTLEQSQLNGSFSQSCEDLENKNPSTTADAVEVPRSANTSKLSSDNGSDSGINSSGLVSSSRRSSLTSVTSASSKESLNSTSNPAGENNNLQKDPTQPKGKEKEAASSKQEVSKDILSKKQPNNRNLHVALAAGCALSTIGCIVAGAMTSGLVGAGLLAMAAVFAIAAVAELHSNFLSSKLTSISVEPHVNDKELTACSHL